jgi:hypothetical protein
MRGADDKATAAPQCSGYNNAERGDGVMADNLVRLGLALSTIVLITACLYIASVPRAVAIEPAGVFVQK